ncbi:hypothetical protein [Arthrobacter sp. ISL-95]|nr:hypothetical protein [Arthrobacter sp. ISL-95]
MTLDRSKFLDVNGYAVPLKMIAERTADGVRLIDGRFLGWR